MPVIDKFRRHAERFLVGSKEVGDCADKIGTATAALGFADPSGATLSISAAVVVAGKACSAISSMLLLLAKAEEAKGEDYADRRLALILLVANEAYFKALSAALSDESPEIRTAVIPGAARKDILDVIESEEVGQVLSGRLHLFKFYEGRLSQIQAPDGSPVQNREQFAQRVTTNATQIMTALLADAREPYRTLQTMLSNEALSLAARAGSAILSAQTASAAIPVQVATLPSAVAEGGKDAVNAEILERLQRIEANQTRETGSKVAVSGSGDVGVEFLANKLMFDKGKKLLEKGRPTAALEFFLEVDKGLAEQTAPDAILLRARALGNVGHCYQRMGQLKRAVAFFRDGHRLAPTLIRLRVNLAIADLTDGRTEEGENGLRALLAEKPDEPDVLELLAESLSRRNALQEAVELMTAHPRKSENYFCILSTIYGKMGQQAKALETARQGIAAVPDADYAEFCAGVVIAEEVLGAEDGSRDRFKRESVTRLREAESHLLRAVELARKEENPLTLRLYLTNLSAVYGSLNKREKALQAAEEARTLGELNHQALVNVFAAQLGMHKTKEAVETARALREFEPMTEALAREMHVYLLADRYDDMIAAYDEAALLDPKLLDDAQIVALRIHAQRMRPDAPGARLALDAALARLGRTFPLVLEEANLLADEKDFAGAERSFLEAERLGTGRDRFVGRVQCGLFLNRRERFAESLHRLVAPDEEPLVSGVLVEYLVALTGLNRLGEVATIGKEAIKVRPFKEAVWGMTASALKQLNRLKEAEAIYRDMVHHDPSERNHLELAGVCFRQRNGLAQAITVLESGRSRYPKSFLIHANLSGLYFASKQYRKAFDAAKSAREIEPERKEGHAAMLRILAAGERIQLTEPEKLLLQESIDKGEGIIKFEMAVQADGQLDLSAIVAALKEQHQHIEELMKMYREKRLPLTVLSRLLNRELIDTWFGITHSSQHRLYCASGTTEEQEAEQALALKAEEVAIDATALIGLQALGHLQILPKLFKRVLVAASTYDKFVEEVRQLEAFAVSPGTLGLADGQLRMSETGEVYHQAKLEILKSIIAFLESDAVCIEGMDEVAWTAWQQLAKVEAFDEWMLAPAFLAKSKNCAYYCDEVAMRMIVAQREKVSGFGTQALLRVAGVRNVISYEAYNEAIMKLIGLNYDFISVSLDIILTHLRATKFAKTELITKSFRQLEASNYTDVHSVRILGGLAANLWFYTSDETVPSRREWIDLCVASLNAAKNRVVSLTQFISATIAPLIDFPEALSALYLHLTEHPGLTPDERQLVAVLSERIFELIPSEAKGLTARAQSAWERLLRLKRLKRSLLRRTR